MTPALSALVQKLGGLEPTELCKQLASEIRHLSLADRLVLLHRLGIYHHPESLSGAGSTLQETAILRDALPTLVKPRAVSSVLDIPCGDFHWMQTVKWNVEYIGAEIVPEIVSANETRFGNTRRKFVLLDATLDALPRVDLIVCRDLLIHLSNRDCWNALENFSASGARLLLASHFSNRTHNPDIVSGAFRPINLCRPPFSFLPPLQVIDENSALGGGTFQDRAMALWNLSAIAEIFRDKPRRAHMASGDF